MSPIGASRTQEMSDLSPQSGPKRTLIKRAAVSSAGNCRDVSASSKALPFLWHRLRTHHDERAGTRNPWTGDCSFID
jgi:hypothetical protein